MGAASVAAVKRTIAVVTVEKAQELAERVLELSTADEIKDLLTTEFHRVFSVV